MPLPPCGMALCMINIQLYSNRTMVQGIPLKMKNLDQREAPKRLFIPQKSIKSFQNRIVDSPSIWPSERITRVAQILQHNFINHLPQPLHIWHYKLNTTLLLTIPQRFIQIASHQLLGVITVMQLPYKFTSNLLIFGF